MELNEIKKILYKTNPTAYFRFVRKNVVYYSTDDNQFRFEVPVNDMGDADFLSEMDSKYMIRWIVLK